MTSVGLYNHTPSPNLADSAFQCASVGFEKTDTRGGKLWLPAPAQFRAAESFSSTGNDGRRSGVRATRLFQSARWLRTTWRSCAYRSQAVPLPALSRLHSWFRPSVSCYFRAFSGSACSRMIVCGRNLLQNVRKNLPFSRECITFAHGSSKKCDVWTSFRLFRFEIPSGEMVEWSITAVLKTAVPRGTGGSNPSLSAKWLQDDLKTVVKTAFKISVNRCKTYTYNDFSLYISLHSDG